MRARGRGLVSRRGVSGGSVDGGSGGAGGGAGRGGGSRGVCSAPCTSPCHELGQFASVEGRSPSEQGRALTAPRVSSN